ncbi:hypothetical protein APHAL10511_002873 [Amanita phalloides]|nr:hypothetical protein APHAL10511_002873 [Amanita phalloides]
MHRAVGPLLTGTYVIVGNLNGQASNPRISREDTSSTLVSTASKNDEPTKWHFERVGHDVIRLHNKETGKAYRPSAFYDGVALDQECDSLDFIIKETEIKGDYVVSIAEDPAYYAIPVEHGRPFKLFKERNLKAVPHWSFFHVDD